MKIAIVGCGNMGGALAERLSLANQLFLHDHHVEKTRRLEREGHGKSCPEIAEAVSSANMLILAVKPQNLNTTAAMLTQDLLGNRFLVSLLAGTPLVTLRHYFPTAPLVRMMPNLALVHGEGVIGLSAEGKLPQKEKDSLSAIFAPLGKVHWIPEEKMDALTALAASGPAFFFAMVEAMVEAGISMGFTAKDAQGLVCQMVRGSLTLLEKTQQHPGELRWQIASPQGTTIAGLRKLEESALRSGVINAFLGAYDYARTLSSQQKNGP